MHLGATVPTATSMWYLDCRFSHDLSDIDSLVTCCRRFFYKLHAAARLLPWLLYFLWVRQMIIAFYVYTGSPIVTSLTFNSSTNTLTCTSIGGPPTNVTWRRDGVVITPNATHQQTQMLTDRATSIYQTVLTINSSVSHSDIVGTYNCTVENVRGGSSDTVIVAGEICTLT